MPAYFLDSSALVKAYRAEAGTPRVLELLAEPKFVFISRLAQVEVTAAIVRRGRGFGAASVSAENIRSALSQLEHEIGELLRVIELDLPIMMRAAALTRIHSLRGADAIQLACGLQARKRHGADDFVFVGSDQELNVAATAEGLLALDPAQP